MASISSDRAETSIGGVETSAHRTRPSSLVVVICSVGTNDTITQVLGAIPRDTSAAFLVLPDVRRGFTILLAERLRSECSLCVFEAEAERTLSAGEVCLVPAQSAAAVIAQQDNDVLVQEIALENKPAELTTRLKFTCTQVAKAFGEKATIVLLSGMGGDAVDGVRAIKEADGHVIVQNEATSLVFDGPREVLESKLADDVLPLWAIGGHIAEIVEGY